MGIKLIAVSELQGWAKLAYDQYAKRLHGPFSVESIQIPTPKRGKKVDAAKALEAKKILKSIQPHDFVILLDERGQTFNSIQFSQWLQAHQTQGRSLCFVLGGPDGFDDAVKQRANQTLSLSTFVLPHHLARVVLLEQIYRAHALLSNHPYHRE